MADDLDRFPWWEDRTVSPRVGGGYATEFSEAVGRARRRRRRHRRAEVVGAGCAVVIIASGVGLLASQAAVRTSVRTARASVLTPTTPAPHGRGSVSKQPTAPPATGAKVSRCKVAIGTTAINARPIAFVERRAAPTPAETTTTNASSTTTTIPSTTSTTGVTTTSVEGPPTLVTAARSPFAPTTAAAPAPAPAGNAPGGTSPKGNQPVPSARPRCR